MTPEKTTPLWMPSAALLLTPSLWLSLLLFCLTYLSFGVFLDAVAFWAVWSNAPPRPLARFHLTPLFPLKWLPAWRERWERERKMGIGEREQQNSRKQVVTRRMPTPSSCRVPAWHRCSGPISSLCSINLRVCRIWLRRCTFPSWPSLEEV